MEAVGRGGRSGRKVPNHMALLLQKACKGLADHARSPSYQKRMHHGQKNRIFASEFKVCTNYDHILDGRAGTGQRRTHAVPFI